MDRVYELFSDWLKRSVSREGIILTEDTYRLVAWLAKAQKRPLETVVNDLLAAELERQLRNQVPQPRWRRLTPREQDMAVLVLQGYTNAQIARTLKITTDTVRTHLMHMCIKYDVKGKENLRQRLLAERLEPDSQAGEPLIRPRQPPGEPG